MIKCYICEKEITKDNETNEHILLNAIGGTLKPNTLICKKCNSEFGQNIDSELAKQLNYICNLLNIKRDNKSVPNLEVKSITSGEKILLQPGGKPIMKMPIKHEKITDNNKIKISIKSPDIKQAKIMLNGLKRKHNEINITTALSEAKIEQRYSNETYKIPVAVGGHSTFRSICKMAINLYMFKNGLRKYIKNLIPYILGNEHSNCVQYYYNSKHVISKNEDEILHSIIIKGIQTEKLLTAYVELFNSYKFVVLLNDNYDGNDVEITYYFDVIQRKEIVKHNNFNISRNEITELIKSCEIPTDKILYEIDKILNIAFKKQENDYILNALENARKNSFDKYSEDQVYTDEMGEEFVHELMEQITPWLANKLSQNRK